MPSGRAIPAQGTDWPVRLRFTETLSRQCVDTARALAAASLPSADPEILPRVTEDSGHSTENLSIRPHVASGRRSPASDRRRPGRPSRPDLQSRSRDAARDGALLGQRNELAERDSELHADRRFWARMKCQPTGVDGSGMDSESRTPGRLRPSSHHARDSIGGRHQCRDGRHGGSEPDRDLRIADPCGSPASSGPAPP